MLRILSLERNLWVTTMLADTIRRAREEHGLSQRELAARAGVSRKHLSDVEAGANVSMKVVEKLAAALDMRELAIGAVTLRPTPETFAGSSLVRDRAVKIARAASDILTIIDGDGERGRVLRFPEDHRPRILFDDEQEQIDELKSAIARSPTQGIEWRTAFRGRGRHKVQRQGDAAAGVGAEPVNVMDEEDVLLREIPEHYWEIGARVVMRVRGDSLIGLGYVDRDLLFIRPARSAANNDTIVCTYQNLVYVKVFRLRPPGRAWLLSANDGFRPLRISPSETLQVHGIVVGRSGYARPGSDLPDPE